MLKPVYLFWLDERKSLLKIVDFEYPNASLLPELRDPDSNDQFAFWIARMGDPIFNDNLSGLENVKCLVQRLGFYPTPLGAEFKHIKKLDDDNNMDNIEKDFSWLKSTLKQL